MSEWSGALPVLAASAPESPMDSSMAALLLDIRQVRWGTQGNGGGGAEEGAQCGVVFWRKFVF